MLTEIKKGDQHFDHFNKAALILMNAFVTPGEFILFLKHAAQWVHSYSIDKNIGVPHDQFDDILELIESVGVPWISSERSDIIANGLFNYWSCNGANELLQTSNAILSALLYNEEVASEYVVEYKVKFIKSIQALNDVTVALTIAEAEIHEEQKNQSLKPAA